MKKLGYELKSFMFLMIALISLPTLAFATQETSFNLHLQAFDITNQSASAVTMDLDIFGTATCSGTPLFIGTCNTDVNGVCDIPVTMNTSYNTIYYSCVYANSSLISGSPSPFRAGQGQIDEFDVNFTDLNVTNDFNVGGDVNATNFYGNFIGDGSGLTNLNITVNGTNIEISPDEWLWFNYPNNTFGIVWNSTLNRFMINDVTQINDMLLISSTASGTPPEDTLDVDGHIALTGGDRYIYSYTAGSHGYNLTVTGGWGGCFDGDTKIRTPTGYTLIKDLNVGDTVVSYDVVTGTPTTSVLLYKDVVIAPSQYIINGINVTSEHPLYTQRGYVVVRELKLTDMLFDGTTWLPITSIERSSIPTEVYNLAVDNSNNYYADGILAKNKDMASRKGGQLYLMGGSGSYGGANGDTNVGYDGYLAKGEVIISNAYSLPKINGTNGQVLTTDGAGTSYWNNVTLSLWNESAGAIYPATSGNYIALDNNSYISFDYPTNNNYIYYDSGLGQLVISTDNGTYFDNNVTAPYFKGDGSQLTNLPSSPQYWNRSAPTIYPANFGDDLTLQNGSIYLDKDYFIDWLGQDLTFNSTSDRFEFNGSVKSNGNITASNFLGNLNWSYIQNAPSFITSETDPIWTANSSTVARIGNCTAGQFVMNTTTGGVQCLQPSHSALSNLNWDVAGHIINSNVVPNTTNAYSLGNSTLMWQDIYLNRTLWFDGQNLTWDSANNKFIFSNNVSAPNVNAFATATNTIGTFDQTILKGKNATIGNSTGNTTITPDGTTLYGTARVNKTIQNYAYNLYGKAGTYNGQTYIASTLASLDATLFQSLPATATGGDVGGAFVYNFITPSDRVTGSNFTVIVHYMDANTETCNIVMGVGEGHSANGESYSQAETWNEQTFAVPTTQYLKASKEFTFDGSAIENGNAIAITVYRYGEAGADTCSGAIPVSSLEIKYLSDKI